MEVAGFAIGVIGVAGLVSVCIDVLEKVDLYRDFDITSKQLSLRFETEKTRLREWAAAVGIQNGILVKGHHPRLDDENIYPLVERILYLVKELFTKTEHISEKIFRGSSSSKRKDDDRAEKGGSKAADPRLEVKLSMKSRLKGIFGDETRFRQHIENLETLVQNLYTLVPPRPNNADEALLQGMATLSFQNQEMVRAILLVSSNLQNMVTDNRKWNEVEELRLIAEILDVPKIADALSNQLSTRLDGTCDWIFKKTQYQEWLSSKDPISKAKFLWLYGPAGFGKTILCSRIVDTLRQTYRPFVFHFFSSLHVQAGGKPEGIINIWLSEIASVDQNTRDLVLSNLNPKGLARGLSSADLWEAFGATVANLHDVFFVLDGFDEYHHHDIERKDFLKNLKDILTHTSCRVLITSRDELDIRTELTTSDEMEDSPTLYSYGITQEDTFSDIRLFSDSIVEQKLGKKEVAFKQELAEDLTKRSDGMFLWVALSGKSLRGSMPKTQLKRIVETTPKGLSSAYERNWREIMGQDDYARARGLRILQWCLYAFRPLTVGELAIALMLQVCDADDQLEFEELQESIDDNYIDEEILDLCASLIDVKASMKDSSQAFSTVQLKHASVKEFLSVKMPRCIDSEFDFDKVSAPSHHLELAKVCLRFLCQDRPISEVEGEKPLDNNASFYKYALDNWVVHSRQIDEDDSDYQNLLAEFLLSDSQHVKQWATQLEYPDGVPEDEEKVEYSPASPLYYAAILGNASVFYNILEDHAPDLNRSGGRLGTPLQAACKHGRIEFVTTLLAQGAATSVQPHLNGTALGTAANFGQLEVARCLISHGAAINEKGTVGRSPLAYAAASETNYIDVVRYLLKEGADVNSLNDNGVPVIIPTIRRGHVDIAKLLLENGADGSMRTNKGETVLNSAAANGRTEIVQLLLDQGVDINLADKDNWTPLNNAADNGHPQVVQLLLDAGADFNILSTNGWSPLNSAAESGHLEIVQKLINLGADINSVNQNGWTPLNNAADSGHLAVVELLIKCGANLETSSTTGWSPVNSAADSGHLAVMEALTKAGADINSRTENGWTALNNAAGAGRVDLVDYLIKAGANLDAATGNGWTSLNNAADSGHLQVVQSLAKAGADIEKGTVNGWTPLNNAADAGHLAIVEFLVEAGAKTEPHTANGWDALNSAAESGHTAVVEFLLKAGSNIQTQTIKGQTPLGASAKADHLETLKALLKAGADPNSETDTAWTPLKSAAKNNNLEMLECLIKAGANVNIPSTTGWTALTSAASQGNAKVIPLLLAQPGIDINAVTQKGMTALMLAVYKGHIKSARLIWNALADGTENDAAYAKAINTSTFHCLTEEKTVELKLEKPKSTTEKPSEKKDLLYKSLPRPAHATKWDHLAHRDVEGSSLLHLAATSGEVDMLDLFDSKVFETAIFDRLGKSVLDCACVGGKVDMIRKILSNHPKESDEGNPVRKWSPLHWACRSGDMETVQLLYEAGYRFSVFETTTPAYSWSPLDVAIYQGNSKIINSDGILVDHPLWKEMNSDLIKVDSASGASGSVSAVRQNSRIAPVEELEVTCDGCTKSIIGVRYKCKTCKDIDYCFMCKEFAEAFHEGHGWSVYNLGPGDYEDPDAIKVKDSSEDAEDITNTAGTTDATKPEQTAQLTAVDSDSSDEFSE